MASATRRTQETAPERKSERMEVRVTPSARAMIQRASAITGLSPGDLALDAARRVINEVERMTLSPRDAEIFFAALENPSPPNERLATALRRHQELFG